MNRNEEAALRARAYRTYNYSYACNKARRLAHKLAMDQSPNGNASEGMQRLLSVLKSKLSPQEFEFALQVLHSQEPELPDEDWDTDDLPAERPDHLERFGMPKPKSGVEPDQLPAPLGAIMAAKGYHGFGGGGKGGGGESGEEESEGDAGHLRRGSPFRAAMDKKAALAFDAAYPDAQRLSGPSTFAVTNIDRVQEQEILRRRRDARDGMAHDTKSEAQALDSFDRMFPSSKRLS